VAQAIDAIEHTASGNHVNLVTHGEHGHPESYLFERLNERDGITYEYVTQQVRRVVDHLQTAFDDVSLRSLHRNSDESLGDSVLVERGRLTDRQREVLETAYELGYFEYPEGANAGEVAEALDITVSTLAEHLGAAQTKVFGDVFASIQ